MPINQENFNSSLYDLLKTKGYRPEPVDSKGQVQPVPQDADVFRFEFVKNGEKYGTVYATVEEATKLIVYYDDQVADSPEDNTSGTPYSDSWTSLLQHLKYWAQRRQLGFELRNKDHLVSDMAQREHMKKKEKLGEGYYPMGKKASYNDSIPQVKIILQHTRQIEEGEQRYRNIAKIFVENTDGERFAVPTTRPGIAKVYARHVAEGGTPYDERGKHITAIVEEYTKMAGFVRAVRSNTFNESAQQLVQEGVNHYQGLRETLSRMIGHRGYHAYFEAWTPVLNEEESDSSELNELFVQETLDPRIESVMPILSKLRKKVSEAKPVTELDEWADSVIEDVTGLKVSKKKPTEVDEDLDANQKRVGQLGPTEKVKKGSGARGKLVGANESVERHDSSQAVTDAIIRRILNQHIDLIGKFGSEKILAAAEEVGSHYPDLEEIGSSDVSGFVKHVIEILSSDVDESMVNEVNPHNYDSDWDYYDALAGKNKKRRPSEPDDDPDDLHPMVKAEIEDERRKKQYEKKFKIEQDWQEGTAPNGKDYNLRYIVTSDDPEIIKHELHKFKNSHDYYMRELVDTEIQQGQGIGYYMDSNSWNVPVKPRKQTEQGVAEGEEGDLGIAQQLKQAGWEPTTEQDVLGDAKNIKGSGIFIHPDDPRYNKEMYKKSRPPVYFDPTQPIKSTQSYWFKKPNPEVPKRPHVVLLIPAQQMIYVSTAGTSGDITKGFKTTDPKGVNAILNLGYKQQGVAEGEESVKYVVRKVKHGEGPQSTMAGQEVDGVIIKPTYDSEEEAQAHADILNGGPDGGYRGGDVAYVVSVATKPKSDHGFKHGDKVHLGVGTKGGAGMTGILRNIVGDVAHVEVDDPTAKYGPRIVKGHVSKLTKAIDERNKENKYKKEKWEISQSAGKVPPQGSAPATRAVAKQMTRKGVSEEASPMIKPPINMFDNKRDAFAHAKEHGGKVYKRQYTNPRSGLTSTVYFVKKEKNEMDEGALKNLGAAVGLTAALAGVGSMGSLENTPLGQEIVARAEQGDPQAKKDLNNLKAFADHGSTVALQSLLNRYGYKNVNDKKEMNEDLSSILNLAGISKNQ